MNDTSLSLQNDSAAANETEAVSEYELSLTAKIFLGFILEAIVVMTIGGNILVLLSIKLNRKLRTTTNYFIISLALADLLLGVLVLPFSAILQLEKRWLFGLVFCDIWASTDVLCCTASILSLCAISIDRYIGVKKPLKHRSIMSKKRTVALIVCLWILSFAISLGPLIGWREKNRLPDSCAVTTQPGYVIFSVLGSFYIPSFIIIAIYSIIYREAKIQAEFLKTGFKKAKIKSKGTDQAGLYETNGLVLRAVTRRNLCSQSSECSLTEQRSVSRPLLDGQTTPPLSPATTKSHLQRFLSQNSNIELPDDFSKQSHESLNTLPKQRATSKLKQLGKQLIVGNKIAKFNKEKRAAKTLGIVVGVFLVCWFPFFFILPLGSLCPWCDIPSTVFDIVFWLGYCNSMLNPIIYATWNLEFKTTFKNILKGRYIRQRKKNLTVAYLARTAAMPSQALISALYTREKTELSREEKSKSTYNIPNNNINSDHSHA